jgi:nucleoside diphosphate kinase
MLCSILSHWLDTVYVVHSTTSYTPGTTLEREREVKSLMYFIGATDPKKAKRGTIRRDLALNTTKNSVHASDSLQNAKTEIEFFFTSPPISPSPFHGEGDGG